MAKSIHQEVSFKASPDQVYAVLTDAETFSAATGAPLRSPQRQAARYRFSAAKSQRVTLNWCPANA